LSQQNKRYTYEDAGFNSFLNRSLKSNPSARTLSDRPSTSASNTLNFDKLQISGTIADDLRLGSGLELQGNRARIAVKDDQDTEVGWVGRLTE
jgi:hypothetical protein